MRVRSFLGVVATLLAIATSTSVSVAGSDWPKSLTLVTGPPGGVYYVYGEALAQVLTEKLGIAVNPLPTQGSVHNVKLIESGGAQLGMTTMGVGLQGWNGTGDWTNGKQLRDMRALFPLYDTPFQAVVLQRSGIATRTARQEADRGRIARGHRRHLYASNVEGSGDFSRNQLWIVRQYGHGAFGRPHRCCVDAARDARAGGPGCRGEGAGHIPRSFSPTN